MVADEEIFKCIQGVIINILILDKKKCFMRKMAVLFESISY